MKTQFLFFISLLGTSLLLAQNTDSEQRFEHLDSVYIDAKVNISRKNSGKTVTVISKSVLDQHRGGSVAQILNEVAGFEINGSSSNNGQNLGYFVRGGKNRQVLILMDGVPLTDASQISNDYDLRLIPLDQVEKIEILKGASSVLYGSGAATAVINITTKGLSKKPVQLNVSTVLGTDRAAEDSNYSVQAITNHVNLSGSFGKITFGAELNHRFSDGLSAIAAPEGTEPFDADTFNAFHAKANIGIQINSNIALSQFVSGELLNSGFDDFSYSDAPHFSTSKQFRTGGHFEWKYKKGIYIFNDNFTILEREISSFYPAKYDSRSYTFDNYVQHVLGTELKVILGLNGNFSKMNSYTLPYGAQEFTQEVNNDLARMNNFDPYLNFLYTSSFGLTINTGVRMNIHSVYDTHWVYQVNPSYYVDLKNFGMKLMGSLSTAYITPSLYQIYDPLYGNQALDPEENTSVEVGIEFTNDSKARLSLIYFQRKEKQFIDFVLVDPDQYLYQYQNIGDDFNVSGLEVELAVPVLQKVLLNANYTYTYRDDRFAIRIPKHKVNVGLLYTPDIKTSLGVNYKYVSDREDTFFNSDTFASEKVSLHSYHLVDLTIDRKINNILTFFARVSNLFNTDFEELYRYQTKGRNAQLGVQLSL